MELMEFQIILQSFNWDAKQPVILDLKETIQDTNLDFLRSPQERKGESVLSNQIPIPCTVQINIINGKTKESVN